MKVEVSCDTPITEAVLNGVVTAVEDGLARFRDRLTRVEVHLKDVDHTNHRDMNTLCNLEARPASSQPVFVSHRGPSLEESVEGAIGKMDRHLDTIFGRSDSPRGGPSASGLPT